MAYTISDLKNDIQRKIHGTSLAKVVSPLDVIYEAGRNLLLEIDPFETKRVAQIENAIFDKVYRYATPADLKGDKVADIYPQSGQTVVADNFSQTYFKGFNLRKTFSTFAIDMESGVKYIDLSEGLLQPGTLLVDAAAPTLSNGTWTAGGDASNLTQNTIRYISGGSSLQFDLTYSSGIGYVENSTISAVDFTAIKNASGSVFMWVYLPTAANFTSVNIRFGTSSTAYYSATATADHANTAFQNGWNLLRFDWANLTTTGSPTITSMKYVRVTYNFTATTLSTGIDSVTGSIGAIYNMLYYSEYLYRSSTGTWKEKPTLDTDIINLSNVSYNILLNECLGILAQQIEGQEDSSDMNQYQLKLYGDGTDKNLGLYKNYRDQYKSEVIKRGNAYYRMP